MEIKDINNATTIQALFAKAVAGVSSGQTLGSGFASLVSQVGDMVSANNKDAANVQENTVVAAEKAEHPDVKDSKELDKKRPEKNEKVEVAEKPQDRRKQKSVKEDASVPMQEPAPMAKATEAAKTEAMEAAATVAAEAAPVPSENAAQVAEVLPAATEAGAIAIVNDAEVVMMPDAEVDLSTLAKMPTVTVFDQNSGEAVSMTGAELVAKIQQASEQGSLFELPSQEVEQFASLIPAEVEVDEKGNPKTVAKNTASLGEGVLVADEALAEQIEALDAKLGDAQKVKVSVDIKEEKISALNDKAIVQDKVALDEIVASALKEKTTSDKQAQIVSGMSQSQPSHTQAANNAQVQMPQAVNPMTASVANAGADVVSGAESAKVSAVEGISSAGANNTTLGTAALAGNAKAEGRAQTSETSFRDIYKGMSKEVIDQVKVNITKSAVKGVDNIEIKLKPEDLGHIEVKMQISKDGKLHAHIISSRPETMEILQREAGNLEKAFSEAGFDMDSGSLSFSFREGSESGQDKNSELRNFIGSVMEHDAESELAGNDNLEWTPAQGLNIRV